MYSTHRETKNVTEIELKLTLLRYNILSKEESTAAYRYIHAGETADYENEWFRCLNEMTKVEDDLRKYGYELVYAGSKTADKVRYNIYKIALINNYSSISNA